MKNKRFLQLFVISMVMLIGCKKNHYSPPMAITNDVSDLTPTSVTLNGVVNANGLPTSIIFEYGTNTDYGQVLVPDLNQIDSHSDTSISADLSELTPNTIYHFRIIATSSAGITQGADMIFTTQEQPTWLNVGLSVPGILITDLVPDTTVSVPWSSVSNYFIDLNGDNINDVDLEANESYVGGGMVLGNASVKISTLNDETQILTDSIYPIALSYGDTIRVEDIWSSGKLTLESYWQSYPPGHSGRNGYWQGVEDKYIGIKYNNQLGWIKLDTHLTAFTLYEYALQR